MMGQQNNSKDQGMWSLSYGKHTDVRNWVLGEKKEMI